MKKIFISIGMIAIEMCFAQAEPGYNTGVTRPVPTISSLATYTNVPVSIQTGIPDISYNLFSIPSNNQYFSINMGLSYHPANASDQWVGDLGPGWSLFGQGVISREILFDFDECFSDEDFQGYRKNDFDDIYNYNIPGESGKFRFIRNTDANTFELVKLTPTTSKIEYQRSANTSTMIVDSFTITTDKGIRYKFEIYNISRARVLVYSYPNEAPLYSDKNYRSAFFLTSVEDENKNVLAKYNYLKDVIHPIGEPHITESENNKLTGIEIKDRGTIELEYDRVDAAPVKSDKFRLKNALLKTPAGQFVSKYIFQTGLQSFTKTDINGNEIEKTKFKYDTPVFTQEPDSEPNPELIIQPVLSEVQLPTGGSIRYNYDFIPFYYTVEKKQNIPEENLGNVSFTNIGLAKKYFFTIPPNGISGWEVVIDLYAGQLANNYWTLGFYKKVGSSYQAVPYSLGPAVEPDPDYPTRQTINFQSGPGEYYVTLTSADPSITIPYGEVYFEAKKLGEPTEITLKKPYSQGLPRVKNVKYFNNDASIVDGQTNTPVKIEEYEYNFFDNPTASSGYYVTGGSLNDGMTAAAPSMVYKNVKVSQGNNTGYARFYFKTPDVYPRTEVNHSYFWPNFNLTRSGLIEKKEVYNASNQKLSENLFDYTIVEYDAPQYLVAPSTVLGNFYLKTSWVKDETIRSKTFHNSAVTETLTEVFRNTDNYKPDLERVISYDGSIQETSYQYAQDKNNQKLIGASMKGIPLETSVIRKKNPSDAGRLVSKTEKKYDNASHKRPTSVITFDAQNMATTAVTFDQYDSKGNLEQYTTKDGIPVSVVWGYNKTQPVAKIEGAAYSQVAPYIADIVTKSNADTDDASELALINALNTFRNLSALQNTQITTYVYDPLIGMKSTTPPSGIRVNYQYDKAGRLDQIVDENGKVLKKYKYNYKQ